MMYRILDLFCCAGGAGMGYHQAGFEVVGVDIEPQKNYPFPFILGDAIDVLSRMLNGEKFLASDGNWYGIDDFDAIHASPPCQKYSMIQRIVKTKHKWPDLVEPTRGTLDAVGKPYVIENVEGAPLRVDLMLCGSMFKLNMIRHRIFELSFDLFVLMPPCNHHKNMYDPWHYGTDQRVQMSKGMGIDWFMTRDEVREAIPPAYTKFIGERLIEHLEKKL
jgi:DNA (cytosine-5)-methyltransferase 1